MHAGNSPYACDRNGFRSAMMAWERPKGVRMSARVGVAILTLACLQGLAGCNSIFIQHPPSLLGYVAQQNTNTIAVFDTVQNTPIGQPISVGQGPVRLVVQPTGSQDYLYVLLSQNGGQNGAVDFVNRRTSQVDYTIGVGRNPTDMAVTPNNGFLYVTNSGDGTVSRIDLHAHSVATIPLQPIQGLNGTPVPWSVAIDPLPAAGTTQAPVFRAYVVCRGNNALYTIRDDQTSQDSLFVNLGQDNAVQPNRVAIAATYTNGNLAGRKLYVTDTNQPFLQIVDLTQPTLAARQSASLNSYTWGIVPSPDGQYVYVTLPNYNTQQGVFGAIDRLNTSTDQPDPPLATLASQPEPIAINASGTGLYVGDQGTAQVDYFPIQLGAGGSAGSQVITPRVAQFTNNVNTTQPPSDIALSAGI